MFVHRLGDAIYKDMHDLNISPDFLRQQPLQGASLSCMGCFRVVYIYTFIKFLGLRFPEILGKKGKLHDNYVRFYFSMTSNYMGGIKIRNVSLEDTSQRLMKTKRGENLVKNDKLGKVTVFLFNIQIDAKTGFSTERKPVIFLPGQDKICITISNLQFIKICKIA